MHVAVGSENDSIAHEEEETADINDFEWHRSL